MGFKAYNPLTTLRSRRATMSACADQHARCPLLALIGHGKADISTALIGGGLEFLQNNLNECLFRKSIVGRPSRRDCQKLGE